MDEVQNSSNSECYSPSSKLFGFQKARNGHCNVIGNIERGLHTVQTRSENGCSAFPTVTLGLLVAVFTFSSISAAFIVGPLMGSDDS
jgi:hypothetical protein